MIINVGIIGCGSITQHRHAPEYKMNKNCKIIAFSDFVMERAQQLAMEYNAVAFNDYHDIINHPDIDVVSICTSNATHAQIAIEAMEAGKHVLCEKPMAVTTAEAKQMMLAAKKNNKVLMPAHNQRLFPTHQKAKGILSSGEMGKVLTFRSAFKHKGPETWSVDKGNHTWFFDKKIACMGVLGDLGIHKVDLMHFLLDERILNISANLATLDKRYQNGEFVDVEDNAIILCHTESGKIGTVEVSWTNYGIEDNSTVLYCENGVIKINCDPEYDLVIEKKDGKIDRYNYGGVSTNDKQVNSGVIEAFVDAVVNKKPMFATADDGYNAVAVIEACLEAEGLSGLQAVS